MMLLGTEQPKAGAMKQRDEAIDILKGILVVGMILSHVSGLVSSYNGFPMKHYWLFSGLVSFSGFFFCFGYVCQFAYFGKDFQVAYRRMLVTALKPLIAFYISGIYWRFFVDKQFNHSTIVNILLLNDIPPFSEFLISYSLIILVSLLLFRPIQILTESRKAFWVICGLLLLTTFIPYQAVKLSQLALFVGTDRFPTYPILQYFPIFLLGVYFAKYRIRHHLKALLIFTAGMVGFACFYYLRGYTPSRFPPSLLWILCSLFFVYGYYLIAQRLTTWKFAAQPLSLLGKNVLFYLLMSNLAIFTFRGAYEPLHLNPLTSFALTALVLVGISFLINIVVPPTKKSGVSQTTS
jgi:hypothetical protein